LINTGASKSYIKPMKELKNVIFVNNPFFVKSIHGYNTVNKKCILNLFNTTTTFFLLPNLTTFDGVIGLDLLKKTDVVLDLKYRKLITKSNSEAIKILKCQNVNFTKVDDIEVPHEIVEKFQSMLENRTDVFAEPNEALIYTLI